MQQVLAEQPVMTSIMLAILGATIFFGWMQTGKNAVLWIALAIFALIPGAFLLANNWVTDREMITEAIYRTAEAVAANDFDRAVEVIEPQQREKVIAAKADLQRFHFDEARVNKLRTIDVYDDTMPLTAEVDMSVTVMVSDKRGSIRNFRVPRRVVLQFRKSPQGQWLVYDYNHMPIVGDPDAYSPQH